MAPYATVAEFADFLDPDPVPANAARLLANASRKLDQVLIGAIYTTDSDGLPTDPDLAEVFREATCLQAQYVADLDDETGAKANVSQMRVGNVYVTRALSVVGDGTPRVSPEMVTLLQAEGLIPVYPVVWG
jgi:hypothetical protein